MLESIRIEGNILDWEGPVEINFADEPIILTGRNGAGKSLIGKILQFSIESIKGDYKARKPLDKLCKQHGVELIVLKLKRPFYEQWSETLFTNLPFFILQKNHTEVGGLGIGSGKSLIEEVDVHFEAHHHMTYTWESKLGHPETVFEHKLETRGYCEGFQSVYPLQDVTINLGGTVKLDSIINGPNDWKDLVHDIVVELARFLEKRNMIVIPLDDKIKLITTDENDERVDTFEFIEYKSENEMRAWLGKYNAIARHEEDQYGDHQLIWQLKHKPPQDVAPTSPVNNSYVKITSVGGYPNYFEDLNLVFIDVNRKYTKKIGAQRLHSGLDNLMSELLEENPAPPITIEEDLERVREKYVITLDRRKTDRLSKGLTNRKMLQIREAVFGDDPENEYDMYWSSNIVEGMDKMHKIWSLLSSDKTETEFSYLLHNFLWNRLMEQGNAEQIIAKIEFGIEFEKLGSKLPSGIGNLLCLLDSALSAAEGTILFIDEPEISLHIDWQAKIVDEMWKLGKRNHIIFTTHSPEIVMTNLEKVITIPPEAL
jgi:hypothetical protein